MYILPKRNAALTAGAGQRGREKKFCDYIRTEVEIIFNILHNAGALRRVPVFHKAGFPMHTRAFHGSTATMTNVPKGGIIYVQSH